MLFGSCSMSHHPHKSGGCLTQGNISLQVVTTSKYLAVCPELPRPSATFPLTGAGDCTAGDVEGSCSSAAPPCTAAPGAQPGRGPRDGSGGREVAGERSQPTRAEEPWSTPMVLCPCKSSTKPRADRDVFLAAAAQLSLLVSVSGGEGGCWFTCKCLR